MTNEERLELISRGLPYSNQITSIDITTENDAIRFTWRNGSYRLSLTYFVEEIGHGVLIGSDKSILMGELLKRVFRNDTQ